MFSALEVSHDNALYKFTFDIDIDIDIDIERFSDVQPVSLVPCHGVGQPRSYRVV